MPHDGPDPKYDVFISYARRDGRAYAELLDRDLRASGFTTWRDTRSINEYQDFSAELEVAIRDARYIIVCVTPSIAANRDSFVRREIIYADSIGKPIIPLVFPGAVVPILVAHLTWIPFFAGDRPTQTLDYARGLDHLLARLNSGNTDQPHSRMAADPYRDYLTALYDQIVHYLDLTVFSLIVLHSEAAPQAVGSDESTAQALPVAFFDMVGLNGAPGERITYNDFRTAFDKYEGRVLLLGEPGAGKTTTLMAFTREAVVQRLQNPALPLPILVPVSTWDPQTQPPLAEWLPEAIPALRREDITRLVGLGETLLLFDGLDELGSQREDPQTKELYDPRLRFLRCLPGVTGHTTATRGHNQVVVSCRFKDYYDIGAKINLNGAVTLHPLDDSQLRNYLREMPDLWAALEADSDLREVARTPLLLSLFAYAYRDQEGAAAQLRDLRNSALRDKIFETYVTRRYEREARKPNTQIAFTLDEVVTILGWIAMRNITAGRHMAENVVFRKHFARIMDARRVPAFVELATLLYILVPHEDGSYRFIHLLLRDYFAYRCALPALASADVTERRIAAEALSRLADARAVSRLIAALDDPDGRVRFYAAAALGRLRDPLAVEPFIVLLRDGNWHIRRMSANLLGQMGDARAVWPLIDALSDEDSDVRYTVAKALGLLGDMRALSPLIAALSDPDPRVRRHAARSLGLLGDERAVQPLIAMLKDTTRGVLERVCDAAAASLEEIGTPDALTAIHEWRDLWDRAT